MVTPVLHHRCTKPVAPLLYIAYHQCQKIEELENIYINNRLEIFNTEGCPHWNAEGSLFEYRGCPHRNTEGEIQKGVLIGIEIAVLWCGIFT